MASLNLKVVAFVDSPEDYARRLARLHRPGDVTDRPGDVTGEDRSACVASALESAAGPSIRCRLVAEFEDGTRVETSGDSAAIGIAGGVAGEVHSELELRRAWRQEVVDAVQEVAVDRAWLFSELTEACAQQGVKLDPPPANQLSAAVEIDWATLEKAWPGTCSAQCDRRGEP